MKANEMKEAVAGYNAAHAEKMEIRCLNEDFEGNVLTFWANDKAEAYFSTCGYFIEEEPDEIPTKKLGLNTWERMAVQVEELEGLKAAVEASAPQEEILKRIAFAKENADYIKDIEACNREDENK